MLLGRKKIPRAAASGIPALLLGLFCLALAAPVYPAAALDIYVDGARGSPANSGTIGQPLSSLEGARDAIRALTAGGLPAGGVTVWVRGGTYYREQAFTLGPEDSGTASAPIVYRSYPNETVIFHGAKAITNWQPLSDPALPAIVARLPELSRDRVLTADLSGLGITDFGSLSNRGSNYAATSWVKSKPHSAWMVELFYNDQRQELARWPNHGLSYPVEDVWAYTTDPVPGTWREERTDNWFTYREDQPGTWALSEGVWVRGMWTYWWADSYEKVISIDPGSKRITTEHPGDYGYTKNRPFEALNVLEELDLPGEWVLDAAGQRLYFYPPGPQPEANTMISVLTEPFVVLQGASYITFRGFVFEKSRGAGFKLSHGSSHNMIAGNKLRLLGNTGIIIGSDQGSPKSTIFTTYDGGSGNTISGNELAYLGEGGIAVYAGDMLTLTPAAISIHNNHIHHFNTNIRCYRPALLIQGVGVSASNNLIHDSPHIAIIFSGNDHLFEYNEIYDVNLDSSDTGIIYCATRDWKQRGTVFRHNFLHPGMHHAFYLDDFCSGINMYGNITMYPGAIAAMIGGGRDNVFENNMVVGFYSSGWHVNDRGNTWASGSLPGLINLFKQIDPYSAPYNKYPGMSELAQDLAAYEANPNESTRQQLALAKGNRISRNVFRQANAYVYDALLLEQPELITETGNFYYYPNKIWSPADNYSYSSQNPPWADPAALRSRNFALLADAEPLALGFQPIAQEQIGIYADAWGVVDPTIVAPHPPVAARGPFQGRARSLPGRLEAEDFDSGPTGEAYYSTLVGNNAWGFGRYRHHADFWIWGYFDAARGSRNYKVSLNHSGYDRSWAEYTVAVNKSGLYRLELPEAYSAPFHILVDGVDLSGSIADTTAVKDLPLRQGGRVLRIVADQSIRLDYLDFILQQELPVEIPDPLKLYFPFDGDTQDRSAAANHGTVGGTAAFAAGYYDSAFEFNGTSYVQQGPTLLDEAFTLALWLKPSALGSLSTIYDEGAGLGFRWQLSSAGQTNFYVRTSKGAFNPVGLATSVVKDQWQHLSAVYDGSVLRIYQDGELKDSYPISGNVVEGAFSRSGQSHSGHYGFKGLMDELRLYSRALTAAEITSLFQSGHIGRHIISAGAGAGGTINPSGQIQVNDSAAQHFVITVNEGYQLTELLVDGIAVPLESSFTFPAVRSNRSIAAKFGPLPVAPGPPGRLRVTNH